MKIKNRLKRLYYQFRNGSPIKRCPIYLDRKCGHSLLCFYPNCPLLRTHNGKDWIPCTLCKYKGLCTNKDYGYGCYDGKEEGPLNWEYVIAKHFFELGLKANNPITASDKGMAEEIIINLKRVENDYCIDLTKEMEWVRNKVKGE